MTRASSFCHGNGYIWIYIYIYTSHGYKGIKSGWRVIRWKSQDLSCFLFFSLSSPFVFRNDWHLAFIASFNARRRWVMQMQSYRTGDNIIRYCEIAKMLRSSFTYVADILSDILSIIFSNVISRDLNFTIFTRFLWIMRSGSNLILTFRCSNFFFLFYIV